MVRLTLCPHCESPASLPAEVDAQFDQTTRVKCPNCGRSFAAAEAAATLASLMGQTEPLAAPSVSPPTTPPPTVMPPTNKRVDLDDLFGLGKKLSAAEEPTGDDSAAGDVSSNPFEPTGEISPASDGVPSFADGVDDAGIDDPVPAFEIDQAPENEPDQYVPTVATATPKVTARSQPKRRYSKAPLIVGVVVGQLLAFAGGYCAVMWIQYARGDERIDPWGLAAYYPTSVLPPGARDAPPIVASGDGEKDERDISEPAQAPIADDPDRFELANFEQEMATEPPTPLEPDPVAVPLVNQPFWLPDAPRYATSDVAQAVALAKRVMPALLDGEFANSELQREKGRSYATICQLAHVLTFYDPTAMDFDKQVEFETQEQVFKRLFQNPKCRNDIGTIAQIWLKSEQRRSGIFFAGQIISGNAAGPVYEYQIELPSGQSIAVVCREPLAESRYASADAVGVVGDVIDNPSEQIVGYAESGTPVVWTEHVFPVRNAAANESPAADPLGGFELEPLPEIDL